MIHMKCQDLFSLKKKKMSAAVVIGALRVKGDFIWSYVASDENALSINTICNGICDLHDWKNTTLQLLHLCSLSNF